MAHRLETSKTAERIRRATIDEGLTIAQMADVTGKSKSTVRALVALMAAAGELVHVDTIHTGRAPAKVWRNLK